MGLGWLSKHLGLFDQQTGPFMAALVSGAA